MVEYVVVHHYIAKSVFCFLEIKKMLKVCIINTKT